MWLPPPLGGFGSSAYAVDPYSPAAAAGWLVAAAEPTTTKKHKSVQDYATAKAAKLGAQASTNIYMLSTEKSTVAELWEEYT